MKVFAIIFASALSRPQNDSNNSTDYEDYDTSIEVRKFSALTAMVVHQLNFEGKTNLDYTTISKRIANYGCYCFREDSKAALGQGVPVDETDSVCKSLMQCRKCIDLDFPGECDVTMGQYKYAIDSNTGEIVCNNNIDTDPCKVDACHCDREFALNFARVYKGDDQFDFSKWTNRKHVARMQNQGIPTFDSSVCENTPRDVPAVADICCGVSGKKVPYSMDNKECCLDETLRDIGSCP